MSLECNIREATEAELESILPIGMPGYQTHCLVAEDTNGHVVGHVCLSRSGSTVIGHDWKYWGEEGGAVKLFFAGRKYLRALGPMRFYIHFTETDIQTKGFWEGLGFMPKITLYERNI